MEKKFMTITVVTYYFLDDKIESSMICKNCKKSTICKCMATRMYLQI